tara:strand:- start:3814 stop:5454 length:1641 start_codon:yes stop_codon:yes gene_type:complete
MEFLKIINFALMSSMLLSQDNLDITITDTTTHSTIFNQELENDSTELIILESIITPSDSNEIIQFSIDNQKNNTSIKSNSVELLNICKSSVYVLDSENLTPLYAERMAEIMTNEIKNEIQDIQILDTYHNTGCETTECALNETANTPATHIFILRTDIVRLTKETIFSLKNLRYDFASDKILDESNQELIKLLSLLNKYPDMRIELTSHTSAQGNELANFQLSQKRAVAVENWLLDRGVDKQQLSSRGFGQMRPYTVIEDDTKEHPFLQRDDILTAEFISGLETIEQQEIASSLNRRTEVSILVFPYKGQLEGPIEISLFEVNSQISDSFSGLFFPMIHPGLPRNFFGTEEDLFSEVETMVNDIVSNLEIESCETGNTAPLAFTELVPADNDSLIIVKLMGSDKDRDTLLFSITSLPEYGQLFQTSDDITIGDTINVVPTDVISSDNLVLYVPASDSTMADSFSFRVFDGEAFSSSADIYLGSYTYLEVILNRYPLLDFLANSTPALVVVGSSILYSSINLAIKWYESKQPPEKPMPPKFPDPGLR